ncbi:MAG: histidine phosphatase family protein [Ruthenibacterium lactatiformans]
MKVYLLRHGQTEYNVDKRYQGTRDIPLSEKGRAALRRADIEPDTVYVSPLCRAVDTARVLFPAARLVPVHDLREMCFGIFEGRNYVEMERDPDYLAWVGDDRGWAAARAEEPGRIFRQDLRGLCVLVDEALARGAEMLVVMAHGGTQMAVMERYACPRRIITPGARATRRLILDAARWQTHGLLDLAGEACYAEEA